MTHTSRLARNAAADDFPRLVFGFSNSSTKFKIQEKVLQTVACGPISAPLATGAGVEMLAKGREFRERPIRSKRTMIGRLIARFSAAGVECGAFGLRPAPQFRQKHRRLRPNAIRCSAWQLSQRTRGDSFSRRPQLLAIPRHRDAQPCPASPEGWSVLLNQLIRAGALLAKALADKPATPDLVSGRAGNGNRIGSLRIPPTPRLIRSTERPQRSAPCPITRWSRGYAEDERTSAQTKKLGDTLRATHILPESLEALAPDISPGRPSASSQVVDRYEFMSSLAAQF